jgi:hypothetical protein
LLLQALDTRLQVFPPQNIFPAGFANFLVREVSRYLTWLVNQVRTWDLNEVIKNNVTEINSNLYYKFCLFGEDYLL